MEQQLPGDDTLILACAKQSLLNNSKWLVYPSERAPLAFIKFAHKGFGMMAEARNQIYAFEALMQMPQQERAGIRIPKVYRVLEKDDVVYLVMEYVKGETLEQSLTKEISDQCLQEKYRQITQAVKLLLSINPISMAPGPVGGGIIKHPLFKDAEAPIEYTSVKKLQEHLTIVARGPGGNNVMIDFSAEKLCFCFSDLYEGNFIFTDTGDLYVIDFEHVSFLPTSFMTYALHQPRPVCEAIRDKFVLPQGNLEGMKVAGFYFLMSWRKIGLEEISPH